MDEGNARRWLVVGGGVIGTVYAARLAAGGLAVAMLARGDRLRQLQNSGAIAVRMPEDQRLEHRLPVEATADGEAFDVVLVAVRREQVLEAAAQVAPLASPSVLFFGNYAGMEKGLAEIVGPNRARFGFPGVGGTHDGPVVRYVQIAQQPTTLGRGGADSQTGDPLADDLRRAGFMVSIVADMTGWLNAHAALVVPIAAAIRAAGGSADALAADSRLLRLMVLATREAYSALGRRGKLVAPLNLQLLYRVMPAAFAQWYWSRALPGPFGELAFAAHTRHAWPELAALGEQVEQFFREPASPAASFHELLGLAVAAQQEPLD